MEMHIPVIGTILVLALTLTCQVQGHGRMLGPPSRMSGWRFDIPGIPIEYTDNEQNCGGFRHQWFSQGGKCGICGDRWDAPRRYERPNGKMVPSLVITANYTQGQVINITLQITATHRGWHEFRICDTRKTNGIEATHECLDQNVLTDTNGKSRFPQGDNTGFLSYLLVLPPDLTCPQCVVQWKWHCGNNVGYGEQQEEFYACSDVTVNERGSPTFTPPTQPSTTQRRTTPTARPTPRPWSTWTPTTPTTPTTTTEKPTRLPPGPWNDPTLPLSERLRAYIKNFYKIEKLREAWSKTHIKAGGSPGTSGTTGNSGMTAEERRRLLNRYYGLGGR